MDENAPLVYKHGGLRTLPIVIMDPSKHKFEDGERERDWRPATEYEIARAKWANKY